MVLFCIRKFYKVFKFFDPQNKNDQWRQNSQPGKPIASVTQQPIQRKDVVADPG